MASNSSTSNASDVVDFSAPEWEPLDPVRHAAMVTTPEESIAEYTRQLREGVTEDWQPWYPAVLQRHR
ncbi:hypothetical protein ACGF7U_30955 [Micromonospora sp. NPDC047670]|uniref:hypothetical protein n=1 Tax=Micromonospora sp. NPDC047670 TaxID=3364252 RepID=UPI00371EB4D1